MSDHEANPGPTSSPSPRQVVLDRLDGETRSAVLEATRGAYTEQDDIWIIVLMVMAAIDQRNDRAATAIERAVEQIRFDDQQLAQAQARIQADLAGMETQLSATFDRLRQSVQADLQRERRSMDRRVQQTLDESVRAGLRQALTRSMQDYAPLFTSLNLGRSLALIAAALALGAVVGAASVLALAGLGAAGLIG